MISFSINVAKIEKSRIVEGKGGAKYVNFVMLENQDGPDRYGNTHIIKQSVTQEERERGVKLPIIGNGKEFRSNQKPAKKREVYEDTTRKTVDESGQSIPF